MIKKILDRDGNCVGWVLYFVKRNLEDFGVKFLTDAMDPLQVGLMRHGTGTEIIRHFHHKVARESNCPTPEILFIRKGRVRADIYDHDQRQIAELFLEEGDVLFQFSGGHGFTVLEECEIIEAKLGPYNDTTDKTRFTRF